MNRSVNALANLLLAAVVALPSTAWPERLTAVTGVTVIDGTGSPPVSNATVLIKDDRVLRVLGTAEYRPAPHHTVFEATGKFVMPGIADMHNHLGYPPFVARSLEANLRQLLPWGVTLVFDPHVEMITFQTIKAASKKTRPYPHFFGSGPPLTRENGWGSAFAGIGVGDSDWARHVVRQLEAGGVDAIKFYYDDMSWLTKEPMPPLPPDVMRSIIDEAHSLGLKAFAHAPILKYAKEALTAGADGLVHGIISDPVDDEFLDLMRRNQAVYVSTLSFYEACADQVGWISRQRKLDSAGIIPGDVYDTASSEETVGAFERLWSNIGYAKRQLPIVRNNVKKVWASGIPVVTGTDTGVPGVLLGLSSHVELVLHHEAGIPALEVIRAATSNAAQMLGRETELGSLTAGKAADFLILDADPLTDIQNTLRIHRVVVGGEIYEPTALRAVQ